MGGTIASVSQALVDLALSTDAVGALGAGSPVTSGADPSFLPVIVGLLLAALAEFFRRGTALRDDLEGVI